jgi:DNA-directed RNA polymerase subunit RPC12/RpoP
MRGKANSKENVIIECQDCSSKIASINLIDSPISFDGCRYKCTACGKIGSFSKIAWLWDETALQIWE